MPGNLPKPVWDVEATNSSPGIPAPVWDTETTSTKPGLPKPVWKVEGYQPTAIDSKITRRAGTFNRAVERGIEQTQGLYGQFIKELGESTGFSSLVEVGDELVQEAFVEAVTNPPQVVGLEDLRWSNAGTFVLQTLGEQMMNIGLAGAAAMVAGPVSTMGLRGALMRAGIARNAANALVRRATMKRSAAGTFGAFLPLNTGEIIQEQRDAGLDPDLLSSLVLGVPSSALEVAGFAGALAPLFRGFSHEIAGTAIKNVVKRLGYASLSGIASEGGTEAAQEALVIASQALKDPTFDVQGAILSSEGLSRIAFAGLAGATVGGVLGGGGGAVNAVTGRIRASRLNSSIDRLRGGLDALAATDENNEEQNLSIFDAAAAKKYVKEKVDTLGRQTNSFIQNLRSNIEAGVNKGTLQGNLASIREKIKKKLDDIGQETISTEEAKALLQQTLTGIDDLVAKAQEALAGIPVIDQQRKGTGEGTAARKAGDAVRELLTEINKLKPSEQVTKLSEAVELIRKQIAQGLKSPASINRRALKKLIDKVQQVGKKAKPVLQRQFNELERSLDVNRTRLTNLLDSLPEVETTQEEALTDTENRAQSTVEEIMAGLDKMLEGTKKSVTAVGWKISALYKDKALAKKLAEVARKLFPGGVPTNVRNGEVIIGSMEDADNANTTDVRDMPADEETVVVRTTDDRGRVINQEVTPKSKAAEVVEKKKRQYGDVDAFLSSEAGRRWFDNENDRSRGTFGKLKKSKIRKRAERSQAFKIWQRNNTTTDSLEKYRAKARSDFKKHGVSDRDRVLKVKALEQNVGPEAAQAYDETYQQLVDEAVAERQRTQKVVREPQAPVRTRGTSRQEFQAEQRKKADKEFKPDEPGFELTPPPGRARPVTVEVIPSEEAVYDVTNQRIQEVRNKSVKLALEYGHAGMQYLSDFYKAVTNDKWVSVRAIPNSTQLFTNSGMTWGAFKRLYADAEHLAEIFQAAKTYWADPETFEAQASERLLEDVQDINDYIETAMADNVDLDEFFGLYRNAEKQESHHAYYVPAGNGKLVLAEIHTNSDGTQTVRRADGKPLPTHSNVTGRVDAPSEQQPWVRPRLKFATKAQVEKNARANKNRQLFPKGTEILVEMVGGIPVARAVFPDEIGSFRIAYQIMKAQQRGDKAKGTYNNRYVASATRTIEVPTNELKAVRQEIRRRREQESWDQGISPRYKDLTWDELQALETKLEQDPANQKQEKETIWFHLGEITKLGEMLRRERQPMSNTKPFDRLTNVMANFLDGVAYLSDRYNYHFDFYDKDTSTKGGEFQKDLVPGQKLTTKIVSIKKMKDKVIYGKNLTFGKARKGDQEVLQRVRKLYDSHVAGREEEVIKYLQEYFNVTDPDELSWNDMADFLVEEANKGRIDPQDMWTVIWGQGHFSEELMTEWKMLEQQALSQPDGPGINLRTVFGSVIRGSKTVKTEGVIEERPINQLELFDDLDRPYVDGDGTPRTELVQDLPEIEDIESGEFFTGEQETFEPVDEFMLKTQRDNEEQLKAEFESQHTIKRQPGEETKRKLYPQVRNYLTTLGEDSVVWDVAQRATEKVLKLMGIKERVVLFDEDSQEALMAHYRAWADYYTRIGDKARAFIMSEYAYKVIPKIIASETTLGRVAAPKNVPRSMRVVHIYVTKNEAGTRVNTNNSSRNFVLAHELGHLVQYVWIDRLSTKLRNKIFKDIGNNVDNLNLKGDPKEEAFANWMALYVSEIIQEETKAERKGPKVKKGFEKFQKERTKYKEKWLKNATEEEQEITSFFKQVVDDLYKVWKAIKDMLKLGKHPESFRQFVEAHLQYQRVIDGRVKPDSPLVQAKLKTPLARAIFAELNALSDVEAGYLPFAAERAVGTPLISSDFNVQSAAQTAQRASSSVLGNYVEDMQRMGRRFVANPADAFRAMFYTIDARLRSMDSATALWLARQFHVRPGEKYTSLTVIREIMQRGQHWHNKLNTVLSNVPGAKLTTLELAAMAVNRIRRHPGPPATQAQQTRERILTALQKRTPPDQLSADIKPHVLAIRKYLKELHHWYNETMDLHNLRFLENYYPLMLDTENLTARKDEFIQLMVLHGDNMSQQQAEETFQRIMRDANGGLNVGYNAGLSTEFNFFGPSFTSKKGRAGKNPNRRTVGVGEGFWTEKLRQALIDGKFYQQDLATTLIAYTEMAVRRAVWEKRFRETDLSGRNRQIYDHYGVNINSPIAKLQLKLTQAHQRQNGPDRLTDQQFEDIIKDILPAYSGQLGLRIHPRLRKLSSTMIIYQNIRLLPLAVMSSFVDLPTLMARSGLDMQAWSDVFQTMMNGRTRAEAMQMLKELGAMRINLTEHVLNDQALNTFTTGTAKRINDLFFKYNMMEGWTNLIRAAAAYSGRSFIQRNSAAALQGNQQALEWMEQLGLDRRDMSDAVTWNGMIGQASPKLKAALNRYIDEAMIRPEAALRPAWMSDPGYSVFSHLKGFLYGFHETFLRRVGNHLLTNVKNRDLSALVHQNLLPMLLLMMLATAGAALAYEVRRYVAGLGKPNPRPAPFGNYLQEVVERSGLPGVYQILIDMEQAEDYGKNWGVALGGPSVEQFYDFLTTEDWSYTVARSLPIVAQSPRLTDWMRYSF